MAANEVIELDSDSSDDEYKNPPRKPIGWNYQGTTSMNIKSMLPHKRNGSVCVAKSEEANDEIEIVEESAATNPPRKTLLPVSSTRSEIRKIVRNTKQASIGNYVLKPDKTVTSSENRTHGKEAVIKAVNNNDTSQVKEEITVLPVSKCEPAKLPESKRENCSITTTESETSKLTVPKCEPPRSPTSSNQSPDSKVQIVETPKSPPVPVKCEKAEAKKENNENEDENSETSIAVVENFIGRWEDLKCSKDDQKIRDKLWKYYYLAHSSYTHSRKFISYVENSTKKLTINNIYVIIKELLDCLKRYKDRPYQEKLKNNGEASNGASSLPEETEEDRKRNKKLGKIEKKMKEISDKIRELENQEIDLDDEDNSSYLIEDRLKRQFNRLHEFYCKTAGCTTATGRPIERKFRYTGSRYEEVNKRITVWVNKTKEFPDYVDILNLLKKVTKESSLPLRPETVRVQAQEIFRDVGRLLKDRRESDDLYCIYSYVDDDLEDPASKDEELAKKLSDNEVVAKDKLDKLFQEYVEKEAVARENADKKKDENSPSKEKELKEEIKSELPEEEEEEDEAGDEYAASEEQNEVNDDEEDEDEEEEEEEEEIDDRKVSANADDKDDDNLSEDTDDELRNVIATATSEEDLSEEDVPVIDSEEMQYEIPQEGSSSSVVCLDDNGTDEGTVDPDNNVTLNIKNEKLATDNGAEQKCNKRPLKENVSPQKRLCFEAPKP